MSGLVEIACASRRDYLPHCAAMLASVIAETEAPIRAHLLCGADVAEADAVSLERMGSQAGAEVVIHRVPVSEVADLQRTAAFPAAHWFRVLLPELLEGTRRVIYLDCDVIACSSIAPLANLDLGASALGAVTNVFPNRASAVEHIERLGLSREREYFNSGVMVLDLEVLRDEGATRRVFEFARANRELLFLPEQDAMNAVLWHRRKELHPKFNRLHALELPWAGALVGERERSEALSAPVLRHFEGTGANKPWNPGAPAESRELYDRHLARTPFATQSANRRA